LYRKYFHNHIKWTGDLLKETEFYKNNLDIFKYKKYFGYFLWKPYIILSTMINYEGENKNILYCDSNLRFRSIGSFEYSFNQWLEKEKIFLVKHDHHYNYEWTKRDTFILMDADEEKYWNAQQRWSILLGTTISEFPYRFFYRYLNFCKDINIVTEEPNVCGLPNLEGFREHRWEQSVLSILAEKYNIDGPTDIEMLKYYDKIYSPELLEMKSKTNPLDKTDV